MASMEPLRGKVYQEDLRWRMVYRKEILKLSITKITKNLNVHPSTVWRTVEKFRR